MRQRPKKFISFFNPANDHILGGLNNTPRTATRTFSAPDPAETQSDAARDKWTIGNTDDAGIDPASGPVILANDTIATNSTSY
jgi:hypothetical protein